MRSRPFALALLLAAASLSLPTPTLAQPVTLQVPGPTVTTTGTATVYVVPDEAYLRFDVHTFDADLAKAKQTNDEAAKEVLAFLQTLGIADKDVQATFVTSEALYEDRVENGRSVRGPITGYTVRRDYGVKLRDISKLGAFYDKLLPDTRVTLAGHALGTSHLREQKDQARRDAAKAAREKAVMLAGALGARVLNVRTIAEVNAQPFYGPVMMANAVRVSADANGGSDAATPVGQIAIQAEVTAAFDIAPEDGR